MLDMMDEITKHSVLDGFDRESVVVCGEGAEVCWFRLDWKVYRMSENPDDGYRSYAEPPAHDKGHVIANTFQPIPVRIARLKTDNQDIIEFRSSLTGESVLRVGTNDTDDYYPHWICEWTPENLLPAQSAA